MPRVRAADRQKTPTVMPRLLLPSQASERAYPKALLIEKAVLLLRQVLRLGQGLSLGASPYDGWGRVNHYQPHQELAAVPFHQITQK